MLASLSFTRTVAVVLALSPLPGPALARQTALDTAGADVEPTVELGVDLAFNSRYLFRGMVYSDGPVTQVTAWASTDKLYLYTWSNLALPAAAGAQPLDEIDVGAAYRFKRGAVTVVPAVDLYLYRLSREERAEGSASHTAEASATVAYAAGGAAVFLRHVVDTDSYAGAYFGTLGVRYDRALTSKTGLGAAVSVGWASARYHRAYLERAKPGVSLVAARASATRQLGGGLYLTSHVELTTVPDARLRAYVARPTVIASGLTIGFAR
ncbi:MAG: hypothetical protein KA371_00630 [Acidobacteria bacterium]|nr:hypothetical protein [Acidobacteriota bacterium]